MTVFLSRGASGRDVKVLQASLNFLLGSRLAIDGFYGPSTEKWLRRWQGKQGIVPSGKCDAETWMALSDTLIPPERHLQILLPWSLLQVREGKRVLFTAPFERPLLYLTPGVFRLDYFPQRSSKGKHFLRLSNGASIYLEPEKKRTRHSCSLSAGTKPEALLPLLRRGMPVIVNPLEQVPVLARFPQGMSPEEVVERAAVSQQRFRRTAVTSSEGETWLPLSRPPWPRLWARPATPDGWDAWLPWFQGLILAPPEQKPWTAGIKAGLCALALTSEPTSHLPRGFRGWCYEPTEPAAFRALRARRPPGKGKLHQAFVLADTLTIPVPALSLDWFILEVPTENARLALGHLRSQLSPEKILLATHGPQAEEAARLVKEEGLAGLVFTSPPADYSWLHTWLAGR